jgi:hypothetical protein
MGAQEMKVRVFSVALGLALLVSCASPRLTTRYASQVPVQLPAGEIQARLAAFSLDVPGASAKTTLLSFSERGQASLIEQLGAKSKDAAELLAKLGAPIKESKEPDREADRTVFKRRVVFSIDNVSPGPADRISTARIRLELDPPAHFQDWTQFATKYETADLGSLKFTQNREVDLSATVTANSHATGGAQSKNSDQLEENLKLAQRYISVTGALSPAVAELIQQGAPGIDVAGNLAVDFTIEVDSKEHRDTFSFNPLFDDAGNPKPPGDVRLTRQTVKYASRPAADIMAKATLTATIRHVTAGDETFIEGDDEVEFRTGTTVPVGLKLVPKEAIESSVWTLRDARNQALQIDASGGTPENLQLGSFDDAVALRDYLTRVPNPAAIAARPLSLPPFGLLDTAHAKTLQVEIVKLNW